MDAGSTRTRNPYKNEELKAARAFVQKHGRLLANKAIEKDPLAQRICKIYLDQEGMPNNLDLVDQLIDLVGRYQKWMPVSDSQ
jgi:hypothetical protein